MTKLYLVRHGETVDNKAQIMQGQTPGKLNMKGIEQAEEVARKMAGIAVYRPVKLSPARIPLSPLPCSESAIGAILRVNSSLTCRRTQRIGRTT